MLKQQQSKGGPALAGPPFFLFHTRAGFSISKTAHL
jgi:hypothetical protein